jgi:thiol-disulfide isomerase/thioredoxin
MHRVRAASIAICLSAFVLAGCSAGMSSAVRPAPPAARKAAPLFTLPNLRGGPSVSLAAYRGRPVILNFWAEWCDPCRTEMPVLAQFAAGHPELPVIGIDESDDPGLGLQFAQLTGATYALANDSEGTVGYSYGAVALPITVVVDARGRLVSTIYGPVTAKDLAGIAEQMAAE